jgi:hypothetical protein
MSVERMLERIEAQMQASPLGPKGIRALQLLQMAYRGEIELTPQQFAAAKEALPFEEPKLGAMAVGSISGQDFATLLDRAIRASGKDHEVKQIEARAITSEKSG